MVFVSLTFALYQYNNELEYLVLKVVLGNL